MFRVLICSIYFYIACGVVWRTATLTSKIFRFQAELFCSESQQKTGSTASGTIRALTRQCTFVQCGRFGFCSIRIVLPCLIRYWHTCCGFSYLDVISTFYISWLHSRVSCCGSCNPRRGYKTRVCVAVTAYPQNGWMDHQAVELGHWLRIFFRLDLNPSFNILFRDMLDGSLENYIPKLQMWALMWDVLQWISQLHEAFSTALVPPYCKRKHEMLWWLMWLVWVINLVSSF